MKRILLIGCGGTISCISTEEGRKPVHTVEYFLERIPELREIAEIHHKQLLLRTTTDTYDWIAIGECIAGKTEEYDGFVVTMGTDTLAYCASMLSFMLQGIDKPVAITGAMIPISEKGTDARRNVTESVSFAGGELVGVYVVFGGKIILGCRSSKTDNDSLTAFGSINASCVSDDTSIVESGAETPRFLPKKEVTRLDRKFTLDTKVNPNVVLTKLTPNMSGELFGVLSGFDGFLVEGYGDGNISEELVGPIINLVKAGKAVVVATQCTYGPTRHRYAGGVRAIRAGAISARDMSKEAALTKLMWCLGRTSDIKKIKELMHRNMCGEIGPSVQPPAEWEA